MAEQPKTNLYTCWCGKPRNLELHFCKEHGFLEDKLKQARAEVLAAFHYTLQLCLERVDTTRKAKQILRDFRNEFLKCEGVSPAISHLDGIIGLAQAKILVSVILRLTPLREKLDLLLCDEDLTDEKLREASEGLLPSLADAIRFLRKIEPAAKHLEALLREEREEHIELAEMIYAMDRALDWGFRLPIPEHLETMWPRIVEKARAIKEKG